MSTTEQNAWVVTEATARESLAASRELLARIVSSVRAETYALLEQRVDRQARAFDRYLATKADEALENTRRSSVLDSRFFEQRFFGGEGGFHV